MGILGTYVVSFHKDNIFMETYHVFTSLHKKLVLSVEMSPGDNSNEWPEHIHVQYTGSWI